MLLLLLQSLPPLNSCYHLNYNPKEGLILPVLLQSLPPLEIPLY